MESEIREIARIFAASVDYEFIEGFMKQILTPNEVEEIEKRWKLVKMLDGGMRQRKIAEELHISLCKITRGSRELKKENNSFRKALGMLADRNAEKSPN
jgi:TrpR family transcriptional regulator, trp operon repressor